MELRNETISGRECSVHVDVYGRFTVQTESGDPLGRGKTMDEALDAAKITLAKRKVRVKIPFIAATGEHGTGTGMHAGTGAVLASFDGVNGIQLSTATETNVFPEGTDADIVEEYMSAVAAEKKAKITQSKIKREHMVDLREVVETACDRVIAEQDARALAAVGDDARGPADR